VIPDCPLRTKIQTDTIYVVVFSLDSQEKFPYAPSTKKQFFSLMIEQIFKYMSHPFAVALYGFLALVAIVALLVRFFQFRRRNQNLKLKKGISRHVDDEMAWMKSDISVVIENELIKLKKNISIKGC
jgi:hypothetical protein